MGKNPRLAQAKSKNDKNISGLLNQIEAGKIGIHTFTNAAAYTVAEVKAKIISIEFATSEENHAQFFGQVIVDVKADAVEKSATASGNVVMPAAGIVAAVGTAAAETEPGDDVTVAVELPVTWTEDGQAEVVFTFELNDEEILVHYPAETWHSGKHTILLYYPIEDVVANITNTFNVYMKVSGGTGTVDVGNCVASISGQSMGAAPAWDGKIEMEEQTGLFGIGGGIAVKGYRDAIRMETMELVQRSYSDRIGKAAIGAFAKPVEMEDA